MTCESVSVQVHICVMFFSSVVKNPQHCYADRPCGSDRPSPGHVDLFWSVSAFEQNTAKDFVKKKKKKNSIYGHQYDSEGIPHFTAYVAKIPRMNLTSSICQCRGI